MSDVSPAVAAPLQEKPSNPFSRMIGVFFSPSSTYEDIARKPDWVVPAITILVIFVLAAIVTVPRLDFEGVAREAMEQRHISGPQAEQGVRFGVAIAKVSQYVAPALILGFLAVAALIYWLGVRMFGGAATYLQVYSVVIYGFMPLVLRTLIRIPIILTKHNINPRDAEGAVRSNLTFLANYRDNPVLYLLYSRLDLFALWSLILIVIGLAAASRLSKAKTAAIVASVWVLATLVIVGFASLGAIARPK